MTLRRYIKKRHFEIRGFSAYHLKIIRLFKQGKLTKLNPDPTSVTISIGFLPNLSANNVQKLAASPINPIYSDATSGPTVVSVAFRIVCRYAMIQLWQTSWPIRLKIVVIVIALRKIWSLNKGQMVGFPSLVIAEYSSISALASSLEPRRYVRTL